MRLLVNDYLYYTYRRIYIYFFNIINSKLLKFWFVSSKSKKCFGPTGVSLGHSVILNQGLEYCLSCWPDAGLYQNQFTINVNQIVWVRRNPTSWIYSFYEYISMVELIMGKLLISLKTCIFYLCLLIIMRFFLKRICIWHVQSGNLCNPGSRKIQLIVENLNENDK